MILRASVCVVVIFWMNAIHLVVGDEFKFIYNHLLSGTIELQVIYDGFQIEAIQYGSYNYYMAIQPSEKYSIWYDYQFPCFNRVNAQVRNLKTNMIFTHHETILVIAQNIVLQVVPDKTAIHVEVNSNHSHCFQRIYLDVDNSNHIMYTKTNLSSWLTVPDLSPCINYNLTIYVEIDDFKYKIYNKTVRTVSMRFRDTKSINYNKSSALLSWPNFLGDCTLKYQIIIRPVVSLNAREPIIRESTINEYQLNFLEGCSEYVITISSEGNPDNNLSIEIITEYKAPSPIRDLTADVINNTLLVSWSPPIENQACFGAYNIHIDENFYYNTTAHEHIVLDYKPCRNYNISICQTYSQSNCVYYMFDSSNFNITEIANVTKIDVFTSNYDYRTTIAWNVSSHYQYCIKLYNVRLYKFDNSLGYVEKQVTSGMVKFEQLIACEKYRLHIESRPAFEWPNKIESNFVFVTKPIPPNPPQIPTIVTKTSSSLELETKYENQMDKCEIEMFQISCNDDSGITRSLYDEEGRGTFTNLGSFKWYGCTARVKNVVGWSIPCKVNEFMLQNHNLSQNVEVYVNSVSPTTIEITWTLKYSAKLTHIDVQSNAKFSKSCEFSKYQKSIPISSEQSYIYNSQLKINDLEPNTNYSIQVNSILQGINFSNQILATTDPDVPFQVTNLKVANSTTRSVTVTWQLPCKLNGRVRGFSGKITEIASTDSESVVYKWFVPYHDDMENFEVFHYTENRIKPEHQYNISVAIKLANFVGPLNETNIVFISIADSLPGDWATLDEEDLELRISDKVFADYKDNELKLLISEIECGHDNCTRECQFKILPNAVKISLQDLSPPRCEITNHNRIELKRGVDYSIEGQFFTTSGDVIRTHPIHLSFGLTHHGVSFTIVAIILICIAILLIAIGAVISYYMIRKKQASEPPPDSTYTEVEYFDDFSKIFHLDSYLIEYQAINDIDLSDLDRSVSANQPGKNRYVDITPYDYNRVVLMPSEFCTSDYINASHIDGYKRKRQYIAAQGPTEATVYDFWHMVVTQKCDKIVMLTQLQEDCISKCFQYFPFQDEILEFNDIVIGNVDETNFGKFIQRGLSISKGQSQRIIIHYQFIAWPDRGCPTNELDLIEFIEFTKSSENKLTNPMVVHCSAGVGQTGTFIALDILFQRFRNNKFISISETVRKLRRQRCRMVQTVCQYEFLYVSLNMYYLMRVYKGGLGNKSK